MFRREGDGGADDRVGTVEVVGTVAEDGLRTGLVVALAWWCEGCVDSVKCP